MTRKQLYARDEEIVRILNDDNGDITATERENLLEEKATIELVLFYDSARRVEDIWQ